MLTFQDCEECKRDLQNDIDDCGSITDPIRFIECIKDVVETDVACTHCTCDIVHKIRPNAQCPWYPHYAEPAFADSPVKV